MPLKTILASIFLSLVPVTGVNAQQAQKESEPAQVNIPVGQFFYKLGAFKGTVLIVYVNSNFYELYIWEKEQLLKPVFEEQLASHATLATIAIRDAKTGKTVGTYSPKTGALML